MLILVENVLAVKFWLLMFKFGCATVFKGVSKHLLVYLRVFSSAFSVLKGALVPETSAPPCFSRSPRGSLPHGGVRGPRGAPGAWPGGWQRGARDGHGEREGARRYDIKKQVQKTG